MVLQVPPYPRGRQNGTALIVQIGLLQFAYEAKGLPAVDAPMVWVCLAFSGPRPTRDYSISGSYCVNAMGPPVQGLAGRRRFGHIGC